LEVSWMVFLMKIDFEGRPDLPCKSRPLCALWFEDFKKKSVFETASKAALLVCRT